METTKRNDELITIMIQGFYGNRVLTEVTEEDFDRTMLGCLDSELFKIMDRKIDRTIIPLPGTENLVLIYNKYQEEEKLQWAREIFQKREAVCPLAMIPELGLTLFSRCAVCRITPEGKLASLEGGDGLIAIRYLMP